MASTKTTNAVITYLLEYGNSPRIDIAKALSLTKASVTLVTNDMLAKGIIVEQGEIFDEKNKTLRGRRKILLSINPDYKVTIGVTILEKKLILGITNLNGDIFAKKTITHNIDSYEVLLNKIVEEINIILKDNLIKLEDILAAGIVVSKLSSMEILGSSVEDAIVKIKTDMSTRVPYNVVAGTIAKSSLLAQRVFGNINAPDSLFMLTCIEGVDIGLCINSKLFNGKNNHSGGLQMIEQAISNYMVDNDMEILTNTISTCFAVMDMHNVFIFGGVLSDLSVVDKINYKLNSKVRVNPPIMCEDTLFLSGCGQALFECLILG